MYSELELKKVPTEVSTQHTRRRVLFGVRLLLILLGTALAAWVISDPRFRDLEGLPTGRICLPISATVAIFVLAFALDTSWQKFASWLALALVGQAASLQFIEAGNLIHYQHYQPFSRLGSQPTTLAIFLLQMIIVGVGLVRHGVEIRRWLEERFKLWQLVLIAVVFVVSSAALSRDVRFYVAELALATLVQTVNLANIVMLAWAFPKERLTWFQRRLEVLEGNDGVGRRYVDRFSVIAAIWVFTIAALLSVLSYERHPHVPDEVAYVQHARIFAAGQLTLPAPPVREAFEVYLLETEAGRWFVTPPFGWPAVLAIGTFFGVAWLVNPLLAGFNVLLIYALARELSDRRTARWIVLLLCVSPWHLFLAMSFMTHILTLTCALAAALGVAIARRSQHARWTLIAGGFIGLASLIRPLEGLILAVVLGLWSIGVGGRRLKLTSVVALVLGTVVVGALALPYNKKLTGSPTSNPIMLYTDKHFGAGANALGFGPNRGWGWELDPYPGHGLPDAAVNTALNLFSLNIEMFGWGFGSLLPILLLLFAGSLKRSDYYLLGIVAAVVGAHVFYWYSGGPDFGARYWFLILVPCVVLTIKGIQFLANSFKSENGLNHLRVTAAILALCMISLANYFPWRAIDKYHHYLRMRPDIRYLARDLGFGRAIVLIKGNEHPDYVSAFAYNPLDLQSDETIYAWDRNPTVRAEILKAFPDRPVWVVNGPSITGRGYEVVSGPIPAQTLLAAQ